MKKFAVCSWMVVLIFFVVTPAIAQKYVIGKKTAPVELTLQEWVEAEKLETNNPDIRIGSFSIRFVLYDRNMEIVSRGNEITEEMVEGLELLLQNTSDPREFYIDKVVATKDGKTLHLPQHKIRLK